MIKKAVDLIGVRLINNHSRQRILRNFGWLIADNILRMGIGLLVGIAVARYLGPEQFGTLNYVIAFTAMFGSFGALGLDQLVIRYLVSNESNRNRILGTAFTIRLCGGILAACLSISAVYLLKSDDYIIIVMCSIAAGGLLFGAFDVFDMWFQSRVKSKYTVIAKNIALIVCAAAKVLFIISKAPLIFFVLTNSIEVVIGAVGLVMLYSMSGQSITDFSWSSSLAWQLVKEAWPLAVSGLMIMIYMKIDQIMLAEIAGRHELGIYSAAVRVADPWYFIPAGIISSVFPSLIKAKQENEQKYYQRLQLLYCIITWTGISGSVIMSFLAFPVVKLLYGDQYIGAGEILAINVWVGLFISLGVARSKWLIIENLQRYSLVCLGFGLVVNVILNFLLIPIMQARGAAFSALASQITVAIIAPYFFSKTRISTIMILKSFIPVNEFRQLLRHFKTDSC